jgi:hypothetical protein
MGMKSTEAWSVGTCSGSTPSVMVVALKTEMASCEKTVCCSWKSFHLFQVMTGLSRLRSALRAQRRTI